MPDYLYTAKLLQQVALQDIVQENVLFFVFISTWRDLLTIVLSVISLSAPGDSEEEIGQCPISFKWWPKWPQWWELLSHVKETP